MRKDRFVAFGGMDSPVFLSAFACDFFNASVNMPLVVIHKLSRCRHTRREAGIQCHGWRAQIRPCILDSGTNPSGTDLH